ncbi:21 kDa protein [Elaeis guineensis]|uniref:21 kDa protein n=1 Tax=Elaeis guineensis var. tenera TaxID=51953 RepID=A0A6I9R4F6_ELAGV|nr:21 kDa protein [Elaeis guineensis]
MENHISTAASSILLAGLLALLFTGFHLKECDGARVRPQEPTNTRFIRTSCSATKYPILCFNSLSSYASTIQNSPMKLAHAALSVSLSTARSTSTMMSRMCTAGRMKPREVAAVSDCMENLGDSVDELQESLAEMAHMRGKNMGLTINDIQTWVSAALTDDDTCMDGFAGNAMNGEVKNAVRGHVVKVARLTSNALALINALSSTQFSP